MHSINLAVWSVSLALQVILLAVLFVRRLARRVPLFTFLIAFYVVRSVLTYGLSGHVMGRAWYNLLEAFATADTVLQILVAIEIAVTALRQEGQEAGRRVVLSAFALMGGIVAAIFFTVLLPTRGRVPIDRGAVFASMLMVLLYLWMAFARLGGPARRIVEGFAAYGAVAIAANVVRNQAALHRSGSWYVAASYTQSGVYVLAVLYWILMLRPAPVPRRTRPKNARTRA
jgi:hypothetical protein